MARITLQEAQAWAENTKLNFGNSLNPDLLANIEEEVIGMLTSTYDPTTWVDSSTTPKLVRVIISKLYVAWFYAKAYSEDSGDPNQYVIDLKANATMLLSGIIDGTITIPGLPNTGETTSFYPTDASSAMDPRDFPDDPSVGPAKFSMTSVF